MLMKNPSTRLQRRSSGAKKKNREKNKTLTSYIGQLPLFMIAAFEHLKAIPAVMVNDI